MERAIYDRMAEIDAEHWWFAARRRIVSALIAARAPQKPSARILEVGAGTGSNLAMLRGFGSLDAIEPDARARALASRRGGFPVVGGFLPDRIDLPDHRYDLIVLLDVLEHIEEDAGSLRVLRGKLAPGGRLVLTVPAAPWLWSAHDVAHHHKRRYTARTLRAACHAGGLAVRHMSHFNTLLYPAIAMARPSSASHRKLPAAKCARSGRCGPMKAKPRAMVQCRPGCCWHRLSAMRLPVV